MMGEANRPGRLPGDADPAAALSGECCVLVELVVSGGGRRDRTLEVPLAWGGCASRERGT